MPNPINTCPIWGTYYEADVHHLGNTMMYWVMDSPRAGGAYEIPEEFQDEINALGDAGESAAHYMAH